MDREAMYWQEKVALYEAELRWMRRFKHPDRGSIARLVHQLHHSKRSRRSQEGKKP